MHEEISQEKKYAWATYIYGDRYVKGAASLIAMLKKVSTKYDLIVLVPEGGLTPIGVDELKTLSCTVKFVPDFSFKQKTARFNTTLNKFQVYDLIEYDKVCFIDTDIIFYNNYDYIFNSITPSFLPCGDKIEGGIFLVEPTKGYFSYLASLFQDSSAFTDEELLVSLRDSIKNNKQEYSYLPITQIDYIHDIGYYKYWYLFDTTEQVQDFIYKNDFEFLKQFFQSEIYQLIKKRADIYNNSLLKFMKNISTGYIP